MANQIIDPVTKLLERDASKEDMLRALGLAQRNLADAVAGSRCWRSMWPSWLTRDRITAFPSSIGAALPSRR
jgi:hypothetical protein